MSGKSLGAFTENWIVWAVLLPAFGAIGAALLWAAGHLELWWPMTGGMAVMIGIGALAYSVLIPIERTFRLSIEERAAPFVAINLAVSWGLSIAWGWCLGGWAGDAGRLDAELLDGGLVYLTGILRLWLTSNSIAQLFNGALYMWGSLAMGLAAFLAAIVFA